MSNDLTWTDQPTQPGLYVVSHSDYNGCYTTRIEDPDDHWPREGWLYFGPIPQPTDAALD